MHEVQNIYLHLKESFANCEVLLYHLMGELGQMKTSKEDLFLFEPFLFLQNIYQKKTCLN